MPLYLPPKTHGSAAIATCDRCKKKAYYDDLIPDGNSPGLRVHRECSDVKDPYRYPARKTENISLRFPRPDTELVPEDNKIIATENDQVVDFPPEIEAP